MATNLIDLVKGYLTPDVTGKAASYVGEAEPATQKALTGIVPTLVAALAGMGSTSEGVQHVSRMLDANKYDGSALGTVGNLFGGGMATQEALTSGKGVLESLFGGRLGEAHDAIGRSAGIRTTSAATLMALVVPIVLAVLGRQRTALGGGLASLGSLLGEQKAFLSGLLPAGLASLLGGIGLGAGLSSLGAGAAGAGGAAARATREAGADVGASAAGAAAGATRVATSVASRGSDWGIPVAAIVGLILVALGYLWAAGPMREASREGMRRMAELQLPGGARISVPEGAFNFTLATWLGSSKDPAVPRRFVFDNLNFETGSTALTSDSRPTVDSLVAILQAYPAVAIVLEGHTDSTGDAAANKKLSLDRAVAVKEILVTGGIADARVATAGLGSEKPIASNDTEDGRAKNRRLELVVEKR